MRSDQEILPEITRLIWKKPSRALNLKHNGLVKEQNTYIYIKKELVN